jgi:hypothetical protein
MTQSTDKIGMKMECRFNMAQQQDNMKVKITSSIHIISKSMFPVVQNCQHYFGQEA